jgi:hypothetical protein
LENDDKDEITIDCEEIIPYEMMEKRSTIDVFLYEHDPSFNNPGEIFAK